MEEDNFINWLNDIAKNSTESKQKVTELYIKGIISKEEYIKRMRNAK